MKMSIGPRTVVYPTPAFLVGSYDDTGRPNLMTVAWGGICCSQPPCVAVSLRKATYSHGNITARQAFTVNIPAEGHERAVDYCGMVSGKTVDKFEACGLTPVKSDLVDAPYVAEFPLILECRLYKTFELGSHTQFVGEIVDVKADPEMLKDPSSPDVEKVRPVIYAPENGHYYALGRSLGKAFSIGRELQRK